MKYPSIFFCLILFPVSVHAQQKDIDSLVPLLKANDKEDTTRVKLLNAVAFAWSRVDPEMGLVFAREAISIADKLNDDDLLANAWNTLAANLIILGEADSASLAFETSIGLFEKTGNRTRLAAVLSNFGSLCSQTNNLEKANALLMRAIDICRETDDAKGLAGCYTNLATVYLYLSDYSKSIAFSLQALPYFQSVNNQNAIASISANMGNAWRAMGDSKQAIEKYKSALFFYEESGNKGSLAILYLSLAVACVDLKRYEEALEYYERGLKESEACNYKLGISSAYMGMGLVYIQLTRYEKALVYLKKGITMQEEVSDKTNLCLSLVEMGNFYCKIPDALVLAQGVRLKDRYKKALEFTHRALSIALEIGNMERQRNAYEGIYRISEQAGNYKDALVAYRNSINLRDSIVNIDKVTEINRLALKYDFDKRAAISKAENEKREVLAHAEIRQQRTIKNSAISGIGILLVASGVSFVFYKRKRDAVIQKMASDFQVQVTETELKALRAQMNPHFIFNSLNSIGEFIAGNDIKKADYYIAKFAKVMRMILENSEHKEITLAEDMKALELYMQLEALRLKDKFRYEIIVDKTIDPETILVPPLILQPFVENSIWHGMSGRQGTGLITIRILKEDEMINCVVEDNGIGRKKTLADRTGKENKSLGMKITQARIDIINRIRKTSAEVIVSDPAEGTRVEVKLPLIFNY